MKRTSPGWKYVVAAVISFASVCQAGVKEGGGGIIASAEFATAGRSAIEILGEGDKSMNVDSILEQIKKVKVIPVDQICYTDPVLNKQYCEDGHFDKVNNVILVNSSRWSSLSCRQKLILSSHEFLRASGYEAEDYGYSGRFLNGEVATCFKHVDTDDELSKCNAEAVLIQNMVANVCRLLRESQKQSSNL